MAFQEKPMGFFTDTSICIGCKACEVACKEWNQLEGNPPKFTADSFDNTGQLDAQNWRHVQFIEQVPDNNGVVFNPTPIAGGQAWLMMSDVCKHCKNASCMEVCPTNALMRTEYDTVYIQNDVCNGCRNCISACPYGVIGFNEEKGIAQKCTLCYDRLQGGLREGLSDRVDQVRLHRRLAQGRGRSARQPPEAGLREGAALRPR